MSDATAEATQEAPARTWSKDVSDILDKLENFTLLQLKELKEAYEERFDVTAAAAMPMGAMMMPAQGGGEAEVEEKTAFDVVLTTVGDKKIQVIKAVREITSLGLKEAKALVDEAPKPVKTGVPKDEAEEIKKKLEEAGASIEIK